MNETTKTAIFLLLATILVAGAWFARPVTRDFQADDMLGAILFPQFTNPLDITSLEIVRMDATGTRNEFRIAEVNGVWSIPSHENYPADARDQMARVAESLTDLRVLEVIQPDIGEMDVIAFQTRHGVIDPTDDAAFGEGVGTRITIVGANNETLVDLIIGRSTDQRQPQDQMDEGETLRYVRVANQEPVYVVSIDPGQFATDFDRWIERNLLDISTFDIREVFVDRYSVTSEYVLMGGRLERDVRASLIGDITFGHHASAIGADKWSLARWMIFEPQYTERQLARGRELDTDTLDGMISALHDLRIVGVLRKPASLAAALREGTTFDDIELDASMQASMQRTGFWLVEVPNLRGNSQESQEIELRLLATDGDLQLRMRDGIVYTLRFGDRTGTTTEITSDDSSDDSPRMLFNRYLFITAGFDPAMIPLPELCELPDDLADIPAEELEANERHNQREQERYDAAIERGRQRAMELSARFADWYYVISDDVHRRIHLTEANAFRVSTQPVINLDLGDFGVIWDDTEEDIDADIP